MPTHFGPLGVRDAAPSIDGGNLGEDDDPHQDISIIHGQDLTLGGGGAQTQVGSQHMLRSRNDRGAGTEGKGNVRQKRQGLPGGHQTFSPSSDLVTGTLASTRPPTDSDPASSPP